MDAELNQVSELIEAAVSGRTDRELLAAPGGKWCAAQILEHLSLTFEASARSLRLSLSGRRAGFAPLSVKQRFARFLVLKLGTIPAGRQAPEMVIPGDSPEPLRILEQLRTNLRALDEVLRDCEKAFGPKAPISEHPILGAFSVEQWRRFHLVHVRHHLPQIAERCSASVTGSQVAPPA